MELDACLMRVGLTANEAALYRLLCTHGELTGYEAAKLSGISRSNAYGALAGLVEKGGAHVIEGTPQKYTPVPPAEFCQNKRRELNACFAYIQKNMPKVQGYRGAYITLTGDAVWSKAVNMIREAKQRIYISAHPEVLRRLTPHLKEAVDRGLKVVVLCKEAPNIGGMMYYPKEDEDGAICLIADSKFVLMGEGCTCLFSDNQVLVQCFKQAMRNEMTLIEMKTQASRNNF